VNSPHFGVFVDWASSKWALSCAALPSFPAFSLRAKSAVSFRGLAIDTKIDQVANATGGRWQGSWKIKRFGSLNATNSRNVNNLQGCIASPKPTS
jgi:hypothetical protein